MGRWRYRGARIGDSGQREGDTVSTVSPSTPAARSRSAARASRRDSQARPRARSMIAAFACTATPGASARPSRGTGRGLLGVVREGRVRGRGRGMENGVAEERARAGGAGAPRPGSGGVR
ncbi:hypothetical protein AcW1_005160 [Taiwanofungus camphoratus]|nr:hypothetical protein AcW1_005160 [Antrodia cinnamomea]